MMQSKKVTVAQNDVISTHCYMFSLYQLRPWPSAQCHCPLPALQRRRRCCNRQRCCCYTTSPSQDAARLLHATVCASAFRVMTALLLCRVRINDKICACTAIAGFSLQKENKNVTRSSDSLSIKQTHLHASMHKHTQTRTQMLVSSLQ